MTIEIFQKIVKNMIYVGYVQMWFFLVYSPTCPADVLFVDPIENSPIGEQRLSLVAKFYGLDIEHLVLPLVNNDRKLANAFRWNDIRAMVIPAQSLPDIKMRSVFSIIKKDGKNRFPLLVLGVSPEIDLDVLRKWSEGAVMGCKSTTVVPPGTVYVASDLKKISRQLAGLKLPGIAERVNYLILDKNRNVQTVAEFRNSNEEAGLPIFVRFIFEGQEVFFLTQIPSSASSEFGEETRRFKSNCFSEIAPLMMFLSYAYGERCWHFPSHFANLTIDDPWLTEPYGHLSYKGLLEEMETHNFHTTIAFIPWNFDRSKPEVVSLLREHPDRFSISIHGNNHDHYEFYKYKTKPGDPWLAKPLSLQEANIKQALARMHEFKDLTNIPYDRVMVFPHGIAPEKTLGLLKKYNFLSTVNAGNVPLESKEPDAPLHWLRSLTFEFENFPSINRYTPDRSQCEIAIDLFLDNPVLLYAHYNLFENGIEGFNKIAEIVNQIQPDIQWRSLGYITKRLYLQRLRDDGNHDVLAFTSNFVLENKHGRNVTYFVRKEESFSPVIKQVTVDGHLYSYERSENEIALKLPIPAGESRHIVIEYENDLDLASIDTSKNDLRINLLRKLSDFRDMTLSTNVFGRAFIHCYYETDLYKLGLKRLAIILFLITALLIYFGFYLRKKHKI